MSIITTCKVTSCGFCASLMLPPGRLVSDAMGQAPSIQDGTFTTKLPADVDEEQFGPSSTSLPLPIPRRAGGDPTEVGFAYFIQKCRFVVALPTSILGANQSSASRSLSKVSEGDVLATIPMIQSRQLSVQNNSKLKLRIGCWSSPKRFASTPMPPMPRHPPKFPPHRKFRPSVANSQSSQIN